MNSTTTISMPLINRYARTMITDLPHCILIFPHSCTVAHFLLPYPFFYPLSRSLHFPFPSPLSFLLSPIPFPSLPISFSPILSSIPYPVHFTSHFLLPYPFFYPLSRSLHFPFPSPLRPFSPSFFYPPILYLKPVSSLSPTLPTLSHHISPILT